MPSVDVTAGTACEHDFKHGGSGPAKVALPTPSIANCFTTRWMSQAKPPQSVIPQQSPSKVFSTAWCVSEHQMNDDDMVHMLEAVANKLARLNTSLDMMMHQ